MRAARSSGFRPPIILKMLTASVREPTKCLELLLQIVEQFACESAAIERIRPRRLGHAAIMAHSGRSGPTLCLCQRPNASLNSVRVTRPITPPSVSEFAGSVTACGSSALTAACRTPRSTERNPCRSAFRGNPSRTGAYTTRSRRAISSCSRFAVASSQRCPNGCFGPGPEEGRDRPPAARAPQGLQGIEKSAAQAPLVVEEQAVTVPERVVHLTQRLRPGDVARSWGSNDEIRKLADTGSEALGMGLRVLEGTLTSQPTNARR